MTATYFDCKPEASVLRVVALQPFNSFAEPDLAAELDSLLTAIAVPEIRHIVVDLRRLQHFTSTYLEALRRLWKKIHDKGGKLVVTNSSPMVKQIISVTKFDRLLCVCDNDEAVAAAIAPATLVAATPRCV